MVHSHLMDNICLKQIGSCHYWSLGLDESLQFSILNLGGSHRDVWTILKSFSGDIIEFMFLSPNLFLGLWS